jgi:outer membrane receptor protein involved in Fe transport
LEEIVISPGSYGILDASPAVVATRVSREDIEATPQFGDDVFRTLKRLPGVSAGDISAKLSVRGSEERNLLVRLDGLELFEPYHLRDFEGTFGIVDVQSLGDIDLIMGGFPAEFGSRWGAVFDMRTRHPPPGGTRTTVGMSLNSVSFIHQGASSSDRGQWLLSLRRGFLEYVLKMVGVEEDISPSYWDLLGKFRYALSDDHILSMEVLHAGDGLGWRGHESGGTIDSDWADTYAWTTWKAAFSPRVRAVTMLSGGRLTKDRIAGGGDPRDGIFSPLRVDAFDHSIFNFGGVRQDWSLEIADDLLLKSGIDLRISEGEYLYEGSRERLGLDQNGHLATVRDSTDLTKDVRSFELGAHMSMRGRAFSRLTWETGVRFDRKSHTGDNDLAPRLLLRWDQGPHTTLRVSWGHYRQSQGIRELDVADGDTLFSRSERAELLALGIERRLGHGWKGAVEAYSRVVRDPRPVHVNFSRAILPVPEAESDRIRLDPTRARARGVELRLAHQGSGPWSFFGSYVFSRADQKVLGRWSPVTLDQRHTLSVHAAYQRGRRWQISGSWRYHSGWPITPQTMWVVGVPSADTGERTNLIQRSFGPLNGQRLPPYHRLDLRLTRNVELHRGRLEIFLDIFNVYNRENIRNFQYSLLDPEGDGDFITRRDPGQALLPIMPTFGFRWVF